MLLLQEPVPTSIDWMKEKDNMNDEHAKQNPNIYMKPFEVHASQRPVMPRKQ